VVRGRYSVRTASPTPPLCGRALIEYSPEQVHLAKLLSACTSVLPAGDEVAVGTGLGLEFTSGCSPIELSRTENSTPAACCESQRSGEAPHRPQPQRLAPGREPAADQTLRARRPAKRSGSGGSTWCCACRRAAGDDDHLAKTWPTDQRLRSRLDRSVLYSRPLA